jgi:hypothetical protein
MLRSQVVAFMLFVGYLACETEQVARCVGPPRSKTTLRIGIKFGKGVCSELLFFFKSRLDGFLYFAKCSCTKPIFPNVKCVSCFRQPAFMCSGEVS